MASPRQSYSVLAKREVARAAEWNNHASPYCAIRSKTHSACNRYSDILAYDRTAVRTKDGGYLNANVVRDHKGRWWVAAQAPTPATFHAFFSSIIDRTASSHPLIRSARKRRAVLVQLTDWTERGLGKADPYLPPTTTTVGSGTDRPISLETLATTTEEDVASTKSILRAGYIGSEEHTEITHYRFVLWPDHGVPSGPAVGAMRRLVEEVERRREDSEIWIHCSAGVGRTGTFIALASLLGQPLRPSGQSHSSALGPLPPGVKEDEIAATVDQLREWRGMLVQSPQQFGLLYQCMADR